MPAVTPVTTPLLLPIVATPVAPLVHTPPLVPSVSVVVAPAHNVVVPVIATGLAFIVVVTIVKQPVGKVYDITAVPAATPVTTPVEMPTVATPVLPLVHMPPPVVLVSVVAPPTQARAVPLIEAGLPLIVAIVVARQPVLSV